jgi:hypothetical protein
VTAGDEGPVEGVEPPLSAQGLISKGRHLAFFVGDMAHPKVANIN